MNISQNDLHSVLLPQFSGLLSNNERCVFPYSMGGSALTQCKVRRYSRDEFFVIRDAALEIIRQLYNKFDTPFCLDTKQDFGDLDVIVSEPLLGSIEETIPKAVGLFNSKQFVRNDRVVSLEFREFQIDLIHTPEDEFDLMKGMIYCNPHE